MFDRRPNTKGGLWDYRRLVDGARLGLGPDADISIFNWPGNDYREASIIDAPACEVAAAAPGARGTGSTERCTRSPAARSTDASSSSPAVAPAAFRWPREV